MKYLVLVLPLFLFFGCSHKTEEQLLSEAQQAETSKDFQKAINSYSEIVAQYPHGQKAEEAQYKIALIYNNELHDMQKAIAAYRTLYTNYPSSNNAPSALFLCGFLFNNELHNLDSAKASYNLFLEKYPSHQLAESAKFELSTLGKDPDSVLHQDILAKQTAK